MKLLPPDLLARFGSRFAAGGRAGLEKRRERGGEGEGGEVVGREREGPQVTVEPGPLRELLCHCLKTALLTILLKDIGSMQAVRIDPLRFLAGCCKSRLNHARSPDPAAVIFH